MSEGAGEPPAAAVAPAAVPRLSPTWRRLRTLRRVVQAVVFALFVVLLFTALQRRAAFPLADVFFRLDPLVAVTAMVAGREWLSRLAPALITVALTLALGRVWCGWLCPLGTLLDWVPFRRARRRARGLPPRLRSVKYVLLLVTLSAALFANLSLLILDPLALLTRTMTTAVIPASAYAVTSVEEVAYRVAPLQPLVDRVESAVRGPVLPVVQPVFAQAVPIMLLLLAVIGFNALADRFFCRYVCPLGALLALVSRIAVLRVLVRPACDGCGRCAGVCRQGAITREPEVSVVTAECTMCLDCLAGCPTDMMGFGPVPGPAPRQSYDPGRRQVLAALAGGAAGVALLGTGMWQRQQSPLLLRPPGATDERVFLGHCVRCSQCMKVCPTSGLQPALVEAGLEGLWTPVLKPRLGYCDYGCHACGQVCPSGAIPRLSLDSKRLAVIGIAAVDRGRCLPWAEGVPCIVCEEMCPTPEKAVRLRTATVTNARNERTQVQQPRVVKELCIGCGICEYYCPVAGESAIRVFG